MNPQQKRTAEKIMVALDYATADEAKVLLERLKGIPCYMKVGMQLFYAAGPHFVQSLKEMGYKVFLDVKMHDIPNTVMRGAESITRLGVDMFNVHAAGGIKMMEAALDGVEMGLQQASLSPKPIVIGVTQLTSTDQLMLNDEIGIDGTVEDAVLHYAKLAKHAGLQGVVASPWEVEKIKQQGGDTFVTVTPGIRPAGFDKGDQSRIMTPREALLQGTDYMVIGRPITKAADPREAVEQIITSVIDINESM